MCEICSLVSSLALLCTLGNIALADNKVVSAETPGLFATLHSSALGLSCSSAQFEEGSDPGYSISIC